ncbi:MAG: M48 family metallopeptidase [Anaerolineae bacterium]|nr:M48 family metallopeptidase [Anaerolineae bacterium]
MTQEPQIRIIRSDRRRRTVSARLAEGGAVLEVLAPAAATDAELAPIIENLKARVLRHAERQATADDDALARRAAELNRQYFDGKLRWSEIRYVTNQQHRYGSCTPATGVIRISHRVATMPAWVRDYVIVHELAHLREPNHGVRFWKLVNRYPRAERARGYLICLGLEGEEESATDADDVEKAGLAAARPDF